MKTITPKLIVFFLTLITATTFAQTIRRVNNTGIPLGANMYATLQAAHNAAVNDDIIYVEGSGAFYAGATITKRLTIIGPGYLLAENYPNFADVRPAEFTFVTNAITFNAGSEGSIVTGCSGFVNDLNININVSNITVTRNRSIKVNINSDNTPLTGIVISKNYELRVSQFNSQVSISMIVSNNYVINIALSDNFSGIFSNNIINGNLNLRNFSLLNNIFFADNGSPLLTNCTFSNNIDARALVNANAFGTTNGNMANVDKANLFVGVTGNSTDGQWKLKAGSPAIGAGLGGIDCGIFGGLDSYALSGIVATDYPTITSFTTSGVGNSTTPLTVKISTKSN
ncbi:MAG: hypothetical protein KF763_15710 [Cyclobacteriaceae bacterium]|nr:hypothetical protein [Cyclobacteriaceae bacterium]